jgi:dipeptidase E
MDLLLLSSSRTPAGYLTDYLAAIRAFSAGVRRAAFVPFAAVSLPWHEYAKRVSDASGLALRPVEQAGDLAGCDLVVVGGGNTFQLLRECRNRGLMEVIREKVKTGTRYLGWSAGANLACPTIRTTNDMPIVDPGGLEALGLIGFQINPHYVNVKLPDHHGETRDERLAEFARVNPKLPVLALPEGDWLRVSNSTVELGGAYPAMLFAGEQAPRKILPGRLPPNFGDTA